MILEGRCGLESSKYGNKLTQLKSTPVAWSSSNELSHHPISASLRQHATYSHPPYYPISASPLSPFLLRESFPFIVAYIFTYQELTTLRNLLHIPHHHLAALSNNSASFANISPTSSKLVSYFESHSSATEPD